MVRKNDYKKRKSYTNPLTMKFKSRRLQIRVSKYVMI